MPDNDKGRAAAWFLTVLVALTVILIVIAIPARAEPTASTTSPADPLHLHERRGKVVLIDFWASWCAPCRLSFPWLNRMQARYAEDGLVIIGVNLDEDRDDAQRFLDSVPADFELVYDPEAALALRYEVEAMPSSYIIGRDGDIVARHYGFLETKTAQYEQALVDALEAPRAAADDAGVAEPGAH